MQLPPAQWLDDLAYVAIVTIATIGNAVSALVPVQWKLAERRARYRCLSTCAESVGRWTRGPRTSDLGRLWHIASVMLAGATWSDVSGTIEGMASPLAAATAAHIAMNELFARADFEAALAAAVVHVTIRKAIVDAEEERRGVADAARGSRHWVRLNVLLFHLRFAERLCATCQRACGEDRGAAAAFCHRWQRRYPHAEREFRLADFEISEVFADEPYAE